MGITCSTDGRNETWIKKNTENLKGRNHLGHSGIH
jgi:hypothetical protein